MRAETRQLAHNTVLLYILAFSSQLLNVITIPYQTRILGPEWYGVVGMIVGVMGFVMIALDFGFLLSATKRVAEEREDKRKLADTIAAVSISKAILSIIVGAVLTVVVIAVESFRAYWTLFALYYLAYAVNAFLPDYFYRGVEDMRTITIRTVSVRVFFTVLVFVFLRSPAEIYALPILLLIGNAIAVAFSFFDLNRRYRIHFCRVRGRNVLDMMRVSAPYFASRSAATAYQSLNAVLLGAFYPGQPAVGYFTSADKILTVAKSASSPVADSLFPYMVKRQDYRLCFKILLGSVPLLLFGGVLIYVYAAEICTFLFGSEYYAAGALLRLLLPALIVIFPTYIICFPLLVPMGLARQANRSTFIGAIVQGMLLILLFTLGCFSAGTLCAAASVSEVIVFVYRAGVVVRYRDRLRMPAKTQQFDNEAKSELEEQVEDAKRVV